MPSSANEKTGYLRPYWIPQSSGTTQPLNDIEAPSESVAWAVGYGGTIVHTTNGGENWYNQTSGTTMDLSKISAPSANVAWALGPPLESGIDEGVKVVIKTTNGGGNWYPIINIPLSSGESIADISAPSDSVAWVGGSRIENGKQKMLIFHTTNGGESWHRENITNNTVGDYDAPVIDIEAASDTEAYAVGYRFIAKTSNGGLDWMIRYIDEAGAFYCTFYQKSLLVNFSHVYIISPYSERDTVWAYTRFERKADFTKVQPLVEYGFSGYNEDYHAIDVSPQSNLVWVVGYEKVSLQGYRDNNYIDNTILIPSEIYLKAIGAASSAVAWTVGEGGLIFKYIPQVIEKKEIRRLSGDDRYGTAVEISKAGWSSADTVILARGNDFADGLVAAPLSYEMNAPLLLTEPKNLPEVTKGEIKRLQAKKVIIIGSEDAIYPSVVEEIKSQLNINNFERIGGETRYDTSVLISEKILQLSQSFNDSEYSFIMTTGVDFPDALSAASVSAFTQTPILLVRGDRGVIPSSVRNILLKNAIGVYIIGGTDVVLPDTIDNWWFKEQGIFSERLSGDSRYDTCKAVADWAIKEENLRSDRVFIAYGENFPDALALGTVAGRVGAPLLLVRDKFIPDSIKEFLTSHKDEIKEVYIAGETDVVSQEVENQVKQIIGQ